ncbi:glycosyl hydrolase family 18 protein [Cohnella herbarum]|uniref:Glycosyl hydrolase n=1 Tax=Cohnella herbarum TaxID=2728023 RepID=A0A7Z2VFR8_9BACL|nr:glycosyl hydrolase family 18 protein [Cohnella herbarum]QJD82353.1 glycosyl hydrolase [Cohnella herbarum]
MKIAESHPRRRVAVLSTVIAAIMLYLFIQDVFGAVKKQEETEIITERSAWLADWRWEAGTNDLEVVAGGLTSLQVFAAYFDESDSLLLTDKFREAMPRIKQLAEQNELNDLYLTVVNDIKYPNDTDSQKNTSLVTRLVADWESRSRHIDEIIAALETFGFTGAELDYEKIAEEDWPKFAQFIHELDYRLQKKGKSLRVVLEPRAPIERIKLPKGPAYVMMAYNLYGGHSGPGPKADAAFIRKHATRMKKVPGNSYIALSSGGFDWHSGTGKAVGITEKQASELATRSESTPERDKASGSLHFEYNDSDNVKHTVWYADGTTLSQWIDAAKAKGIQNIAIWRLDELGSESLEQLRIQPGYKIE